MESSCIVLPVSFEEVSKALMLVTKNGSPFTIKGGGHTPFTGASNIENGVAIALDALNAIGTSTGRSVVVQGDIWSRLTTVWPASEAANVLGTFSTTTKEKLHSGQDPDSHLIFQPLTNPSLEAMQRNGGNPTGLGPSEFPSCIISVPTTWTDPALDDFIEARTNQFFNDLGAMAKARGFGNGYEYVNYVGKLQDVIARYGEENQAKLQAIARKYDPEGLSRKLWGGYFKPFQPLTNPSLEAMQRNGGNPTGLGPSEFPSCIISVPTTWTDPALDDFIEARTNQFFNDLGAMAKARGFGNGYEYVNYVGKLQDVIARYGEENQAKLQAIARKYDPEGLS
ncbi:FAD-dependent monooxygenase yanF, partial [Colletotrichum shisoi]